MFTAVITKASGWNRSYTPLTSVYGGHDEISFPACNVRDRGGLSGPGDPPIMNTEVTGRGGRARDRPGIDYKT